MTCSHCQTVNPDQAKFCQECGSPLSHTCPSCSSELPAGAKFCIECGTAVSAATAPSATAGAPAATADPSPASYTPRHLAEKILRGRSALEGARKQVTVLFVDIKESQTLAEQTDPELWHRILDGFFGILSDGIHRFEGTINQYTGDGVMALFGAPIAHEDHAQRACYASLALQEKLAEYADGLRRDEGLNLSVRMGLNSGEVIVGAIGDDLRMDYTAQGHTVGMAARIESLAAADRVYMSSATASLVRDYFELRDLGKFRIKGSRAPERVFELEGIGAYRTRLDVSRARGLSSFVGRSEEMDLLRAALDDVTQGGTCVVGVVAEGGAGKSRLFYEFAEIARARGYPVVTSHCVAHGKMIPFYPVLQILKAYFGVEDGDSERQAREKVAGKLLLLDSNLECALPLFFDFLGFPDPERPLPPLEPDAKRRLLFDSLRKMVEADDQGRNDPDVIIVEDLQWIDGASQVFLEQMVTLLRDAHCLVLVNFRPEYDSPWKEFDRYREIELAPLGEEALIQLCEELFGTDPSVEALVKIVRRRTAGNPFFIEETVRALVDAGSLEGVRGAYQLVRPTEDVILPQTVESLVAARIDNLDDASKEALETAAVIGKEFAEPVLRRVLGIADDRLAGTLARLADLDFVDELEVYPEARYAFHHPLTQEVAYRSQLGERRAAIHGSVARVITELYADHLDDHAALLAHHWEGAGHYREAADARRRAAVNADNKDVAEAGRHWHKVAELVDRLPDSAEAVDLAAAATEGVLSTVWRLGLDRDQGKSIYKWGLSKAEAAGDPLAEARMLTAWGQFLIFGGRLEEGIESYDKAAALAADGGDLPFRRLLTARSSYANLLAGNLEQSIALSEHVAEMLGGDTPRGDVPMGDYLFAIGGRALPLLYMGRLDEAAQLLETTLERCLRANEPGIANALRGFSVTHAWFRGDAPRALSMARAQVGYAEDLPSPALRAGAYDSLGVALIMAEQWEESVAAFEKALALSRDSGTLLQSEALLLANMAEAYRGLGEGRRARKTAEEAVSIARKRRTAMHECRAYLYLGRTLVRTEGKSGARRAEKPLEKALEIVERTGARAYEPFIRIELAEIARVRGDDDRRVVECTEASRLFGVIGAEAHRVRTESLCAEVR